MAPWCVAEGLMHLVVSFHDGGLPLERCVEVRYVLHEDAVVVSVRQVGSDRWDIVQRSDCPQFDTKVSAMLGIPDRAGVLVGSAQETVIST